MKLRVLTMIVLATAISACCFEDYRRTGTQKVTAKVIEKWTRTTKPAQCKYNVVVGYEAYQSHICLYNPSTYDSVQVGGSHDVCLVTYTEQKSKATRLTLESCSEPD